MITIVQHVPNYVEMGDTPRKRAEVEDVSALLDVPWVKAWEKYVTPESRQWARSDNCLMIDGISCNNSASLDGKRWYWVIGYLDGETPELPKWSAHREGFPDYATP